MSGNLEKNQDNIAISIHNIGKNFKLYHEKSSSIKDYFLNLGDKTRYEIFPALQDISFDVKKGEFVGIVGRNGSGKSTLLKLLAGVYIPDSGDIKINGRLIPFLELGVGFNPELTARENIFLNGTILGLTKKELTEKFDEIVDFAEVREFIDMRLKTFSSGMQVRLAFSVAIQADADIYLLDEILAVGDANFQAKSMAQFRKFKKEGKTVILVTHDMSAVKQYCDKAVYIKNHKLKAIGEPEKVLGQYIYQDRDQQTNANEKGIEAQPEDNSIRVKRVEFIDKENTPNELFFPGDPMTIRMVFYVKKTLCKPVFGIALYKDDGSLLLGDNTFISKSFDAEEIGPGEYSVDLRIPKLNIQRGNILLTVAVTDDTYQNTYLWEEKKYGFSVVSTNSKDGVVLLETEWRVANN